MHIYLLDDWVIRRCGIIFYAIHKLKCSLGFSRDAVIRLFIGKYSSVCVTLIGREDSITAKEMDDSSLTCPLPHQLLI